LRVNGKLIRKTLKTDVLSVAKLRLAGLVFALQGSQQRALPILTNRPNIIMILADDLGWRDLSAGKEISSCALGNRGDAQNAFY
jgi:hypothetical protein